MKIPTTANVLYFTKIRVPNLGTVAAVATDFGVIAVEIGRRNVAKLEKDVVNSGRQVDIISEKAKALRSELQDYFDNASQDFSLPIDERILSPFQAKVYRYTREIPFGRTMSYGDLARLVEQPKATQAIGQAMAKNPVPIIIPCHRVLDAKGNLYGFSAEGGLDSKAFLLRHEGVLLI